MSRPKSTCSMHNDSAPRMSMNPSHRPSNPMGSTRATSTTITPKQLEEIQHRHQLQMTLIKQEARELKEDKAYLVAQNLRLERELCRQNQSVGHGPVSAVKPDLNRRPSFHRSRSQPNADLRDHYHPNQSSPTCSGSSCSSHPWASSGGPSTPSSLSPRSRHSRNASTVSLAVGPGHGVPTLSRRPSMGGGGAAATAPDPAVLLHRLRLASRQQKLGPPPNGLTPLRPLSVAPASDEARPGHSRSNPGSRGPSRRNSLSTPSNQDPPLKGILKPSTPIRPVSSCSNTVVGPPSRPATGMGYYFDAAYDSITYPAPACNHHIHLPHHLPIPRSRRASLEPLHCPPERRKFSHGGYC